MPECLHSATFFPEPEAAEYVADGIDEGVEVFKVHVQVGNFDVRDPHLDKVWGQLAEGLLGKAPTSVQIGVHLAEGRE